jgi:adenylate cyclase
MNHILLIVYRLAQCPAIFKHLTHKALQEFNKVLAHNVKKIKMDNINEYISRITKLANRNQELSSKLQSLVSRYSNIQDQDQKYNELLARFSGTEETTGSTAPQKPQKKVEHLRTVSLLYLSISGFEALHKVTEKSLIIDSLDEIYMSIDKIADENKLSKIKTFGDNVIFATGINNVYRTNPIDITLAASKMQAAINFLNDQENHYPFWQLKIGVHTGPILAFEASQQHSAYSISGDNINVVCRLGEICPPGKINMSEMTYELTKEFFNNSSLGSMPVKYIGELKMYLVNGLNEGLHAEEDAFRPNQTFNTRYGDIQFMDIQEKILDLLEKNLPSNLYYHNVKHTIDVVTEVELIGWAEGLDPENVLLLKIAALFHDAGHIVDYRKHEHHGTLLARQLLPRYNFSPNHIETICRLIMSTKLPPKPTNKMEEVICDSDLDYLGRIDFIPVSNNLYKELKEREMVGAWEEWNKMQLNFIKNHQYFTKTARELREVNKQQQIERLKKLLENSNINIQ